ncbi:MAG: hypothetical protein U0412_07200, partial [Nitrospira sp.]
MLGRATGAAGFVLGIIGFCVPLTAQAASPKPPQHDETTRFALRYVHSLAHSEIDAWAAADLGCLTRAKGTAQQTRTPLEPDTARRCWDETLKAHTDMVAQQAESGVFSATGRGIGLGLLHDRHRATENWKEYPPAVFLSPPVILKHHAPTPQLSAVRTSQTQPMALILTPGAEPVAVRGQAVDVKIVYGDPLTAPLALRPEEIWWVNGAKRQFGPVREVVARFIVVTGLRKFGYAIDRAVMNEALPGAPLIPTTHYGLRPDNGRKFDQADPAQGILKGELVAGSARWWERDKAAPAVRAALAQAAHLPAAERADLLT